MRTAYPSFGAIVGDGGVRFRLWAPGVSRAEVVVEGGRAAAMAAAPGGYFQLTLPGVAAGARYRYRVDGVLIPDPASRCQPEGVHGPSQIVDPGAYRWGDETWSGLPLEALVIYELHVGAFTPQGTFAGVRERLPYLRDLGITAVELMPVADFPGRWNWGYDPAAMFAPSRAYGAPDDLRALVDAAHAAGLAVILDVVCNHFGPDGAYAVAAAPAFLSRRHRTPWGPATNLDGEGAGPVRAFFIEQALHWLHEYHLDGLRLDATHALCDDSPRHFLAELTDAVRALGGRRRLLIAEDNRNLDRLVRPADEGGYGLDAVWSDDYHHQVHCILTGEQRGYFADFAPVTGDLATIIRRGWLYTGQRSHYFGGPRGTDPSEIPPARFVHFIQNHDQIANRAGGRRLSGAVTPAAYRAASALLLCAPQTPLLFMGQEWAASSPFLYFTDHAGELGLRVSEGRRRESAARWGGTDDVADPQDPETFHRCRLDWREPAAEPHAGILRCHRDLLGWRRRLAEADRGGLAPDAAGPPGAPARAAPGPTGGGAAPDRAGRSGAAAGMDAPADGGRPDPASTGGPGAAADMDGAVDVDSPLDGGIVLRRGRYLILTALRAGISLPCPKDAAVVWHSEEPIYTGAPAPPVRDGGWIRFTGPATAIVERAG